MTDPTVERDRIAGVSTSRVVIVTGAARGIGAAIATALAADGWSVALSDLDVDEARSTAAELASEYGVPTAGVDVDIADSSSVRAAVARVESTLGPVDISDDRPVWRDADGTGQAGARDREEGHRDG